MSAEPKLPFRVGFGYDVHRWSEERELILGGVRIPHTRGLFGHSDADVLTHAIMDALLGSVSLGDIGTHFPDTDDHYKGARSVVLLRHVLELVESEGYVPYNVDSVIVGEEPKLAPHIPSIRQSLAECLDLPIERVSVKATTTEGLLYAGQQGGMASYALVLVTQVGQKESGKL